MKQTVVFHTIKYIMINSREHACQHYGFTTVSKHIIHVASFISVYAHVLLKKKKKKKKE